MREKNSGLPQTKALSHHNTLTSHLNGQIGMLIPREKLGKPGSHCSEELQQRLMLSVQDSPMNSPNNKLLIMEAAEDFLTLLPLVQPQVAEVVASLIAQQMLTAQAKSMKVVAAISGEQNHSKVTVPMVNLTMFGLTNQLKRNSSKDHSGVLVCQQHISAGPKNSRQTVSITTMMI